MNMSLKNIILTCFIFISVIIGLAFSFAYFKRELCLHRRGKINYNNYIKMRNYFNLKISNKYVIAGALEIFFIFVLCFMIMFNESLFSYILLLGATLALNVIGFVSYLTSTKYNRNLKDFDDYYEKVESSYANKDKIQNNLKIIENKYNSVNNEIEKLYKKIGNIVLNFNGLPNLDECFEPLNILKKEQEDILLSFDNEMTGVFTRALIRYLQNGGLSNAQSFIFNNNREVDIDKAVQSISNILKNKYVGFIKDAFINLKHKDVSSLVEMINILISFNMFEEKYVYNLIDLINSNPSKNRELIKFLFDKKYVNYNFISKCVSDDKDWVFDYPIAKLVTNNELTTLVAEILKKNNVNMTNKLLMLVDKGSTEAIKNGINVASVDNESSLVMGRYIELLELDGGYNSLSNRYENIALSLNNYFISINSKNEKINAIIQNETFYENKRYLDETYNSAIVKLEPLFMKTFKTMLYFSLYGASDFKYFSHHKINAIYVEYKRQLNVIGLLCLSAVLDAIVLANVKDAVAYQLVKKNIDELSGEEIYEKFYPITGNKVNNLKLYGKDIIQNLFKNNKEDLSTLINHIENERLVLDKIRYM